MKFRQCQSIEEVALWIYSNTASVEEGQRLSHQFLQILNQFLIDHFDQGAPMSMRLGSFDRPPRGRYNAVELILIESTQGRSLEIIVIIKIDKEEKAYELQPLYQSLGVDYENQNNYKA